MTFYGKAAASCTGDSGLGSCVHEAEAEWRLGAPLAQDQCSYSSNVVPLLWEGCCELHRGLWLGSCVHEAEAEWRLGAQLARTSAVIAPMIYPCLGRLLWTVGGSAGGCWHSLVARRASLQQAEAD